MRARLGFVTLALSLAAAGNASAQDRWAPWIGCWDRFGQELLNASTPGPSASFPLDEDAALRPRVCVTLNTPNEVTLTTSVPDQPATAMTVRADGASHPLDDADCHGEQRAEWSQNGSLLFTNGEVTCRDGAPRAVSGLALVTDDGVWVDVRSFRIGGQVGTRVSRYRRAGQASGESDPQQARWRATLTLAEIKEASRKVSPAVLEAAVAEIGTNVVVSKRNLVELADAGVPQKVLDVLVALAYPERFRVERATAARNDGTVRSFRATSAFDGAMYLPPVYYAPLYVPTTSMAPRGGGGPILVGSPTIIVGTPTTPSTTSAINGQGYTRITPTTPPEAPRPAVVRSAAGVAFGPSPDVGGASSSGSSSSGSSGGASGASPGGFSGGGGSTGRTAQPR